MLNVLKVLRSTFMESPCCNIMQSPRCNVAVVLATAVPEWTRMGCSSNMRSRGCSGPATGTTAGMGQEGVMGQVSARVHAGGRNLEQRYARVDGAGKETRGNSRVETVRDGTVARYEQEGVREKVMKGESTDDSMVKAAVERGEQELYASK